MEKLMQTDVWMTQHIYSYMRHWVKEWRSWRNHMMAVLRLSVNLSPSSLDPADFCGECKKSGHEIKLLVEILQG